MDAIRLLIMGNLTMPEYERLEEEVLPVETQTGGVKHNGRTDLETRIPPFGRQTRRPEAIKPDATMANDLLDQSADSQAAAATTDGVELDLAFGVPIEDKPIWVNLYESIRDVFFQIGPARPICRFPGCGGHHGRRRTRPRIRRPHRR